MAIFQGSTRHVRYYGVLLKACRVNSKSRLFRTIFFLWMNAFFEFCVGTRIAKAIQSWKEEPKRPASPIAAEVEQGPEAIQKLYHV